MNSVETRLDIEQLQVAKLQQAALQAATVTVEIGTGSNPLIYLRPHGTFGASSLYVGVNIDSLQHKFLAECLGRTNSVGKFAVLTSASEEGMTPVPLPDSIAHEVYMANVFGEPDSHRIMHQFKDSNQRYHGHSSVAAKIASLQEVKRLLHPEGKLHILETITPYIPYRSQSEGSGPYSAMVDLVQDAGFTVTEAIDEKNDAWATRLSSLMHPSFAAQIDGYRNYLVVAQKTIEA